jgi:hypothetical protein
MSYNLFLDDERLPHQVSWVQIPQKEVWAVVSSYEEFVLYITDWGIPKFVSFDHDLADEHYGAMLRGDDDYGTEKTGYDCAKWLVDKCVESDIKFPQYAVHSMNPVGSENITAYIENAKKHMGI